MSRVLRGRPGGEKVPVRRGQFSTAPAPMTGSFQTARRIHPRVLLVKSIAQHIVLLLWVCSNRAGNLTFYLNMGGGGFYAGNPPFQGSAARPSGGGFRPAAGGRADARGGGHETVRGRTF